MAENYTVTLPHYSVGPNCYDNIGEVTHLSLIHISEPTRP